MPNLEDGRVHYHQWVSEEGKRDRCTCGMEREIREDGPHLFIMNKEVRQVW